MTLLETPDIPVTQAAKGTRRLAIPVIFISFSLLWLIAAINSRGFGPADGCMHYLFARSAFREPRNFVDVWARPVCTLIYAVPAKIAGRMGVCVVSWLMGMGCGAIAFAIARRQGLRWPALALLFTLAQPLLFLHTLTAMTELPFALLLGCAFLAYQSERWFLAALMISLTPLARPEGFGFLLLAAVALIAARQWRALLVLPVGLILWDGAGWLIDGRLGPWWRWLPAHWPWAGESMYGRGNPLTFVALLPVVVSPLLLPATLVGIWRAITDPRVGGESPHLLLCRRLTAAIPVFILCVHTLLYASGKLASFGEARYLLVAAPFWGVCSARGWEWIFRRIGSVRPMPWAAAAALSPLLINFIHPVAPLKPDPDWSVVDRAADWYASGNVRTRFPRVGASHPGIFYDLDISPTDGWCVMEWKRATLLAPRAGTVLFWDPLYGNRNASPDRAVSIEELIRAGWIDDARLDAMLNEGAAPVQSGEQWHVLHTP